MGRNCELDFIPIKQIWQTKDKNELVNLQTGKCSLRCPHKAISSRSLHPCPLTNEGFAPDHIIVELNTKNGTNSVEIPDANNFLFTSVGIGNIELKKSSTMGPAKLIGNYLMLLGSLINGN